MYTNFALIYFANFLKPFNFTFIDIKYLILFLFSQVHFAEPESLTETHIADDWNRKGQWEEYARDRERFKRRIEEVKGVIDPILCEDHRQHVYSNLMHQTE